LRSTTETEPVGWCKRELEQDQADGPGAVDDDVVAELQLQLVEAVDRAGHRLDQRTPGAGELLTEHERLVRGNRHELRAPAVLGHDAEGVGVLAEVVAAAPAEVAVATEERRLHGHDVAHAEVADVPAQRDDLAGELVARDDGVFRADELAVDDVEIGPADPAAVGRDDDAVGCGSRVVAALDRDLAGAGKDDGAHPRDASSGGA
jgi:hypothetical protein